ncbi:germ cell-specific gene 1-like protein [Denticeps clupeoides]|uniref:Germ cell-specific gene 1-like protein n=1 Tax=Denticeps clupeoides TaxID=299321 RepID=A0A8C4AS38_9TELE|nr:germ cell-specific gene 1-like protein [Denticeps clupeoides]XP_028845272.1 germ cell-specific gene 1-like protein [Denticeps clupeoides]
MDRRRRAALALTLNVVALALAASALATSYWCEGARKAVKPPCVAGAAAAATRGQTHCVRANGSDANDSRPVQYVWETGEDKYVLRKFHSGIWFSCEQNVDLVGEKCRSFLNIAPPHERGVLWLCIVAESLYILLLATGGILMTIEVCHYGNVIDGLKLNAFAAIFTVLSGLLGMVAHMMYTTAFQLTVSLGPEDWKPQSWDYSWSYILAWTSFTACMASSVTTINRYTKTILEFKHKRRTIEKSLKIKQRLLDLDPPEQVWDMYISTVPNAGEELLDLSSSSRKLSGHSVFLDVKDLPSPQGEEYC